MNFPPDLPYDKWPCLLRIFTQICLTTNGLVYYGFSARFALRQMASFTTDLQPDLPYDRTCWALANGGTLGLSALKYLGDQPLVYSVLENNGISAADAVDVPDTVGVPPFVTITSRIQMVGL